MSKKTAKSIAAGIGRRDFLRQTAAAVATGAAVTTGATSATLAQHVLITPIDQGDHQSMKWMAAQIMEHFALNSACGGTVDLFVTRLLDPRHVQTRSVDFVRSLQSAGTVAKDQLSAYLIEEFAVTTNVLALQSREALELVWLGHPDALLSIA